MAKTLRVRLDPVPTAAAGSAGFIEGVTLGLTSLGKGKSQLKPDASLSAKITFRLALRKEIRSGEEPGRELLGSLSGEISLEGGPVFTTAEALEEALTLEFGDALEGKAEAGESDEPSPHRPRPRVLPLELDPASFRSSLKQLRLAIPSEKLSGFRFFELESELELGGSVEASFEQNDVLDGRITAESPPPLPCYDVLLIDDVGQPLADVALSVDDAGNETELVTDASGFARLVTQAPGTATVGVADVAALRSRLKPEWNKPDRGKRGRAPEFSVETTVFTLRGEESPSAVLESGRAHVICVRPYVFLARLKGVFFDLNKTFLLKTAIGGMKDLRAIYQDNSPGKLLVVGHTDTSGAPSTNDPLSLERARSVAAYLSDDVAVWEKQYQTSVPESRRWGAPEDEQMIEALLDFETGRQPGESTVAFFRRTRGFPEAASLGEGERKQLITEYMALDGANVKDEGLDIAVVTHGCGENFPLDETGENLDHSPDDGQSEQLDRRVELFFFDKELGVQPPVTDGSSSKPGSLEYPEWRRRATEIQEIDANGRPRDRHMSVILLSNSGNLPLADRKLTLNVDGDPPFEGSTDADGAFEKLNLPAGDHLLTVDGVEVFVSATPTDIVKRPHVVVGHVLITEDT